MIEKLERRRLFAAAAAGAFHLGATPADDEIFVTLGPNNEFTATINGKRHTNVASSLVIDAGDGFDWIVLNRGPGNTIPVTINGEGGNDTIQGSSGAERIMGGAGDDWIEAGDGNDTVYGGDGDDFLRGNGGSDLIDGGSGYDTVKGDAGNDNLSGGDNPDRLRGGDGNDKLYGGGGRDILAGEAGDDLLVGDNGADGLYPGRGTNTVDAQSDDYVDDGGTIQSGQGSIQLTNKSHYSGGVTTSGVKLDVSSNKLITNAGTWDGSEYTGVTGLVASGRSSGNWSGSGIVTSQSAAVGSNFTTIGVANAGDVNPATAETTALWGGQTISGTDTLVMYTYGGDATLDGKINVDDYINIDKGVASGLTGWSNGDFNYDGVVNIDDYTQFIDANIGTQGANFPSGATGVSAVSNLPNITGTARNDRIFVYNDAGQIFAKVNGHVTAYSLGPITIAGNKGDDLISVQLTGAYASEPVIVTGGAGNDTILTGDGNDRIDAGEGNDMVQVGGGKNTVYGGAGNDSISGGSRIDLLDGGDGIDTLVGNGGLDHLTGEILQ